MIKSFPIIADLNLETIFTIRVFGQWTFTALNVATDAVMLNEFGAAMVQTGQYIVVGSYENTIFLRKEYDILITLGKHWLSPSNSKN